MNENMRYLRLLASKFPTISSVSSEIINLEAILRLPKPTEHFLADLHGANAAFQHVLRNASGNIKRKVKELFATELKDQEIKDLCTLIYYPEEKLEIIKQKEDNLDEFYEATLNRLIPLCRDMSSKYTRSKVRKSLPEDFAYIIEELLHESSDSHNKHLYYNGIIKTIIETKCADQFIAAMCYLIQRLAIDQLHILGDIFDRGPGAHLILDTLCTYRHIDIQWGNHDMLWMGAAAGNLACIATVLRLSLRYANTRTLEDGYGISLISLATFAMETYADDPCTAFIPRTEAMGRKLSEKDLRLLAQMHKAISVIGFKLEGQLYKAHPEWGMEDRILLDKINFNDNTVEVDGVKYELTDNFFPTINPNNPCQLSDGEAMMMRRLRHSFEMSDRLRKHINYLLRKGAMYGIYNSNLLFHASVPLNEDGTLKHVVVDGEEVAGKALMQKVEQMVRLAFDHQATKHERKRGSDYIWYLWCGPNSPLFDKSKMATFERYFIADKKPHEEIKGNYYKLRNEESICDKILDDFGVVGEHRHIINGHVPVHVSQGENPIKANGKLMVIDGGFAAAFHETTGIAGYTLVYHSRGFELVQHEPFSSTADAIERGIDIRSTTQIVEMTGHRKMVADTDKGAELRLQIQDLKQLLDAYRRGTIKSGK